ncbi:MAG: hypothetical protein HY651_07155 [Acidobacteria bacterium]|nr:hypothetical protein [Acidobacteriota bacterium]
MDTLYCILAFLSNYRTLCGRLMMIGFTLWSVSRSGLVGAVQANQSASPLKIVDVLFEDYEGWPSPRLELKAGGEAVLNFRVEGFERREGTSDAGYPESRVSMSYEIELRDPQGALVEPVKVGQVEQVLGQQDDKWRPLVRWSAMIPEWAPSGDYPILIRVEDKIGTQQAEGRATLQVRGQSIPAADTLRAEHLEFARSLDGPWTPQRYFALRDPVYVRFTVVGYRIASDQRVWVEQDWTVLDAEGKVLIHNDNAVEEQSQHFYPPRFLTTSFLVELENPKPGPYLLRIALRDRLGDQTYSQEAPFTLRP